MGTHLVTGIIQKVLVCKKDIESKALKTQDIEESLRKELNLAYYVCDEEDGVFSWNIKPKMLEGNFVEFLETQFRMYEDTINKSAQLAIDKIKEARTGDKIIELSKEESLSRFQMITHLYGSLPIKAPQLFFGLYRC